MKCPNPKCSKQVLPDDKFCPYCREPLGLSRKPPPQGTYNAEISRQRPGCLVFLVDQSGSMADPIAGDPRQKKNEAVAAAINSLLYNLILRCTKEYVVKPYFHVGIWGYGGADEVRRVFSPDLLSITEVVDRGTPGAGGETGEKPTWFAPEANGRTPMNAAFRAVLEPLERWIREYPQAFPPIIVNLTDGAYTDDNPAPVVRKLTAMKTTDGHVLVFNCHISKYEKNVVPFPGDAQAAALEGLARELYEMSSPLPEPMRRHAERKNYAVAANARGYAFNADLETMIDFLEIGTRAIRDRME